jgi:SHS2 domain-containing protein
MAKQCETFDHTADLGLQARADSLAELLEALAEGLADVICPRGQVAAYKTVDLAVEAEDVEALTVDFLSAVLSAIQTRRFAVAACRVREADEARAAGELVGEPLDPGRHEVATEVKAVTYHMLRVAREGEQWTGRVILDL